MGFSERQSKMGEDLLETVASYSKLDHNIELGRFADILLYFSSPRPMGSLEAITEHLFHTKSTVLYRRIQNVIVELYSAFFTS